ncbi:MAG: hypothetical protein JNK02_16695 [Planctomycetes bacterium]|nr:hypothetical protein [Planctomycetota bacterium]
MFALFESLGGFELLVVGIGALLLFGKDLPKVAADAGAQIAKLKRSLDTTWRDSGLEREVRQIRDALPRDLSLGDVARSASEKLAVRLEEEERVRTADPGAAGPVARGALAMEPLPEPHETGSAAPTPPAGSGLAAGASDAVSSAGSDAEPDGGASGSADAAGPAARATATGAPPGAS